MQDVVKTVFEKNNVPPAVLIKAVIDTPEVRQKMRNYIVLFGFVPSENPEMLPLQVYNIKEQIKKMYLKKLRKDFLKEDDFQRHLRSDSFESNYDAFEEEHEAKQGFEGFEGSGYDNLLPLVGMAGGLLKKGIGMVGKAIKKKSDAKASQSKQVASVDNSIQRQQAVKGLVQNGASLEQIKTGLMQVTKKEVAEDRKGTTKIMDFMNKTVADFKQTEENKAIREKMPLMIGVVLAVAVVGYFLGKK